jgi:CheY-like chemotaxis protein
MPGMDGLEMTRRLKNDFATSHIPVIMLTSKGDVRDQIAGIETGAESYIVKPFNMEYLKTIAAGLLNQRNRIIAFYTGKRTNGKDSLKITSKDGEFMNRLVLYIEENYTGEMSVSMLADHCNVSRTVLYNKIKGLTGLGPVDFVRRMKMNIGRNLLRTGIMFPKPPSRQVFQMSGISAACSRLNSDIRRARSNRKNNDIGRLFCSPLLYHELRLSKNCL